MSKYLLPTAGAAVAFALATGTAHATVQSLSADPGTATGATTASTLTWSIQTDGAPTTCALLDSSNNIIGQPQDCTTAPTVSFGPVTTAGAYTLATYDGADTSAPADQSSPVTVAPVAPTLGAPDTTDVHHPTWTFTVPAGDTASCTVTDSAPTPNTVVPPTDCTPASTTTAAFTADLSGQPDGTYQVAVTVTENGITSSPGTASYTLTTPPPAPDAPTVTPDKTPGNTPTPSFTIGNVQNGDIVNCTATGPTGPVTVNGCDTLAPTLVADQNDGDYTLTVTVTDPGTGLTSSPISGIYHLDTHAPAAPTVTPASATGHVPAASFGVSGVESGAAVSCTVTGAASVSCDRTSISLTVTGTDGSYDISYTVTDLAGNATTVHVVYNFDTQGPATPTITPASSTGNLPSVTLGVTGVESGATVDCSAGAGATVTCDDQSITLDVTNGEGRYVVTYTVTDAAGNVTSVQATYVLDTTAPGQPSVSVPGSPTNSYAPAIDITKSDPTDSISCVLSGPNNFSVNACPGDPAYDTHGGIDGVYSLKVIETDLAGNSSSTTVSWTRDTQAPGQPTVSQPASPTTSTAPAITVSPSDSHDTITCLLTGPNNFSVSACPGDPGFDTAAGDDGTYRLTVTETDAAGNWSRTVVTWVRDTTRPPAPVVAGPSDPTNQVSPHVTISDSEVGVGISCVLTGPDGVVTIDPCSSGNFDTTSDGQYSLAVTATDEVGLTTTTTITWTRDTLPPPAPTVSGPAALTNQVNPNITIGDTEGDVHVSCVLTGPNGIDFTGPCGSGHFDTSGDIDGDYSLVVTATDPAGNTKSTTITWHRDATAPTQPVVAAPQSPAQGRAPDFTVTVGESGLTYNCVEVSGPTAVGFSQCGPDVVLDLAGAKDGVYVVSVSVTDPAGNTSTVATASYELDTTAPNQPVVTAPESPAQGRAPDFAVSVDEPGLTYNCVEVSGPSAVGFRSCGPDTVLDLSTAKDGTYVIAVTVTDKAGNTSSAGEDSYVLDTTPPPAPDVSTPDPLTNNVTVTVSIGDTELGVILTCDLTVNGRIVSSGPCPANGTFNTTGSSDGLYQLVVTATDAAGNFQATTVSWTRDTIAPPAPSVTAPHSPAQGRSPDFALSDTETGVTYSCTVTGPSPVDFTSCGPDAVLDLTGAKDGTYVVTVTATDAAGNTSSATSASYVLDTTPPPAPAIQAPHSPGNSRSPSFGVSDTEAGVHYACTVTGSAIVGLCGPTTQLDLTGSPDGTYQLTVTAIDSAGNISAETTVTYILDTTPPPAPIVAPPASPTRQISPTAVISDTEAGVAVTCTLVGPGGVRVFAGTCPAGGVFDTGSAGDGVYQLTVTATDAAGNFSTTTVTWTRDTVPPPAPSVSAPSSPSNVRNPSFGVSDSEVGVQFNCVVSGPGTASVVSCGATTLVDLGGSDGTYTVTVTATDAAGNVSVAGSATYLLDTTAPTAPGVTGSQSPAQNRGPSFSIGGVEAGGTVTCSLAGPAGSTVTVPSACGNSVGLSLAGQPDGNYTLTVTVTDKAGNVSQAGVATYVLDTTPPSAPSVTVDKSPSNDTTPHVTMISEPGATLTCTVQRFFQPVSSGPCPGDGIFDLSGQADGEFEITVTSTDAAGNVSPPTTVVYVLDTVAPDAATLVSPATPSPVEKPVWRWTGEDGATATCTITDASGHVVFGPATCTSPFTADFTNLPDGPYTISVVLTDPAGNAAKAATFVFLLDRKAPVPPTVVPPQSPDSTTTPHWQISAPRGAILTCTLLHGTRVIFGPAACPAGGGFSLAGLPDGTYTLRVTATDSAGNVSAASVTTYVLDRSPPAAPSLAYSSGSASSSRSPYWGFTLPAGSVGRCELWRGSTLLASNSACRGAVSFNISTSPGTYTLKVYAVDAAGNVSRPMSVTYLLLAASSGGGSFEPSQFGGGTTTSVTPSRTRSTSSSNQNVIERQVQSIIATLNGSSPKSVVKKAANALASGIGVDAFPVINDKLTKDVSHAVQGVVNAVSKAGGGTGFPLFLLVIVLVFLVAQSRIDKRDPKLALASVVADDSLQFRPPPSRGGTA